MLKTYSLYQKRPVTGRKPSFSISVEIHRKYTADREFLSMILLPKKARGDGENGVGPENEHPLDPITTGQ